MHIEITRAIKTGKALTSAQRNSSLFAAEPRVAGKTLRRGSPPLRMTEAEFRISSLEIKRLFLAGAIDVAIVDGTRKQDLRTEVNRAVKEGASKEEMHKNLRNAFGEGPQGPSAPPMNEPNEKEIDAVISKFDQSNMDLNKTEERPNDLVEALADLESMKTPTEPQTTTAVVTPSADLAVEKVEAEEPTSKKHKKDRK